MVFDGIRFGQIFFTIKRFLAQCDIQSLQKVYKPEMIGEPSWHTHSSQNVLAECKGESPKQQSPPSNSHSSLFISSLQKPSAIIQVVRHTGDVVVVISV